MPCRAETILAATLGSRPDAPYSCTGGVCGTCRARVVQGEVRMERNYALEPEEVAAGIVLACQAHPVTDAVEPRLRRLTPSPPTGRTARPNPDTGCPDSGSRMRPVGCVGGANRGT